MDLPLISRFVQSSVDAAMAEYVAPKSLTLDPKNMLAGDDFKKDTAARGVFVVRIKHLASKRMMLASLGSKRDPPTLMSLLGGQNSGNLFGPRGFYYQRWSLIWMKPPLS